MSLSRLLKKCFRVTLAIVILAAKVNSKFCNGGHICSPPKECCPLGCCLVYASSGYRPTDSQTSKTFPSLFNLLLWNHWSFWILLSLLLLFCMCACGMWKKRQFFTNRWWDSNRSIRNDEERSELDSTGSCYPPPQYSRCSSFHYAPPPYTEVTSKPDLYPLVISYRSDNGKLGDNCLRVQYFRNYIVHPAIGSLSDGSTVDSISSTLFGQSIHETDSSLPPTYEEFRIEEQHSTDMDSPTRPQPQSEPQNHCFTQGKLLRNNICGSFLENRCTVQNNEIQQVIVENIHHSIQKASSNATTTSKSKFKTDLPSTVKSVRMFQNSAQSLPSNLSSDPSTNQAKRIRPSNLYLDTFQRLNKSITISACDDPIGGNNGYTTTHQYSSDVILAQPQSYCGSNNELHYHSSDILNRLNHYLHTVNNSYSSEDNLSQPRGSLQDFVSSDGLSHSQISNLEVNNFSTSSDVSSLHGCGSLDSPPQATSPTGEFRNLLDKIQLLPVHKDITKAQNKEALELSGSRFKILQVPEPSSDDVLAENAEISENELAEKSCLLNETTQSGFKSKSKRSSAIRTKTQSKENFPSRSKTFYMPFCHNSLKRNTKLSMSEPVTPVTNIPSPGSFSLSFASNSNKYGSKKSLRGKGDNRPLLQDDKENNGDEVF